MRYVKAIIYVSIFVLVLFNWEEVKEPSIPVYKVIIDPGHGGLSIRPRSKHGDRYDHVTNRYLQFYRDGASSHGFVEHLLVYRIAERVQKYLEACAPDGDFLPMKRVIEGLSSRSPARIYITSSLSRPPSLNRGDEKRLDDPNKDYRLFDAPDGSGDINPGRISNINARHPHLVVSLHCATNAPADYRAMNPILCPPPSLMKKGLDYLTKKTKDKSFFTRSPYYSTWFKENTRRTNFQWFLSDVSQYYTGFPLEKSGHIDLNDFHGYRHNMITWKYSDPPGWEDLAPHHIPHTRWSMNYRDVLLDGPFWEREFSVYEEYRRGSGPEDIGGDNAYASYEIIRYILLAMQKSGTYQGYHEPGKPYVTIWSLPQHVNAITAYLELGYFGRRKDRKMFREALDDIARGIAAGIYSLLAGMEPVQGNYRYLPKGKSIDFSKYSISPSKSYFDIVTESP